MYDLIIVGAGMAGLRVGIEALKRNPTLNCCILEKYDYVGGRVVTFHKRIPNVGEIQWEIGSGRISKKHTKVLALLRKYGLTFAPNMGQTDFIHESRSIVEENPFTKLQEVYLRPLEGLSANTLAQHTLKELLDLTIGSAKAKKFYETFPYYSEIHTLRADIAIDSFHNEMHSNEGFGGCVEGNSRITDGMRSEFLSNGKILMNTELTGITHDGACILHCKKVDSGKRFVLTAKTCVLALHQDAIRHIQGVRNLPVLRYLKMEPLLRIYAVFPVQNGKSWFSDLKKTVTDSPIRYIIPINPSKGVVMISYTDGADTKFWTKKCSGSDGLKRVEHAVLAEIRKLFPQYRIPNPILFKFFPWHSGCTYWLPGTYDVEEESTKSLQPLPDTMPCVFMCGESFAVHQCWMESALDQADKLLGLKAFNDAIRV